MFDTLHNQDAADVKDETRATQAAAEEAQAAQAAADAAAAPEADAEGAEPVKDTAGQGEAEAGQEPDDAQALQEKLNAMAAQAKVKDEKMAEMEKRLLRLQADFENFRRRTSKEKEELSAVVTQGMLKDMLPLLDNFERAMAAEAKDGEAFQKGVEMIFTQFTEILKKNGLEHIEVEGQKFDPNFHQAVMRVQNADMEDDDIAQELQKGYMVKGRVIRPSMVQVVANS